MSLQSYTCQISAYKPTTISHNLTVRTEPVISLGQVSCDWSTQGHVTTMITSDWPGPGGDRHRGWYSQPRL